MIHVGQVVGERYEILSVAGSGGMGLVYHAHDRRQDMMVALKVMHEGVHMAPERFDRECRALAKASPHPGIVRYLDHGMLQNVTPYLAMEWIAGQSLRNALSERGTGGLRSGLPVATVLRLGCVLAATLMHLHANGIAHRDLKPSNVLFRTNDLSSPVLLDLGAARLAGDRELTVTGEVIGTPWYMAPEQVLANGAVDVQADLFSLASVLHECLLGVPTFGSDGIAASLVRIVLEDPAAVHGLRADVPLALSMLLQSAHNKRPGLRPSAQELCEKLLELERSVQTAEITEPVVRTAIGTVEQRLRSILVLRGPLGAVSAQNDSDGPDSLPNTLSGPLPETAGLRAMGVRFDRLIDGTSIVSAIGRESSVDQAAHLARVARQFLQANSGISMMIASGRAEDRQHTVGALVDRAVQAIEGSRPGAILLDELSAQLISTSFECVFEDGQFFLAEPLLIEAGRMLLGRPTPTVGRKREIAVLDATLTDCIEEHAQRVVLVRGDPGVGKSRLVGAFVQRCLDRAESMFVLRARGEVLSTGSAYGVLSGLFQDAAGTRGASVAVASERFASLLDAEGIAGEHVWSGLASLIGLSVGSFSEENRTNLETPTLTSVGAQIENASGTVERIAHPAEAFGTFLRRAAAHRPTLVIVDDLQWADPESVRALDALLVSDPQIPLFVLGVARPEIEAVYPELFAHRGLTTLNLEPLPKRAAGELVRSAMGASASEELVEEIVGRAAGNAFFLEELIRYAAAGGRGFPDSVLGIVQARLDALPSEARRILRAASVFGEVAWQGGVGALVGESSLNFGVAHWLNDLVSQELLTEHAASRIPGEREVRFRHAIVRDAVYATLVDDERKTAHSAAGRWLESVNFDDPSVLARHSREGGEGVRAMKWLLAAAKKRLGGRG